MRTSIATVCLSGRLPEKLEAAARAGFDAVEIFDTDLISCELSPEAIASYCAELGLSIELFQPFRDFEGVEPSVLEANLRRADKKFEIARRLGTHRVLVCSNVASATVPYDEVAVEQLRVLGDLAQDHGVQVLYEALAWGRFVSTSDHAWRIVEAVNHSAVDLCLDSFHVLSRGRDLSFLDEIPGEKIGFLQIADAPEMDLDPLSWSRHHRVFPGEGSWDLAEFVSRVQARGYDGPISLEIFNDTFRAKDPVATAKDARRSLAVLEADLLRKAGPHADGVRPGPEPVSAIDFIELVGTGTNALRDTLRGLGFTCHGNHRRKDVELWTLGNARIVVNHGAPAELERILALGFSVADAEKFASRARELYGEIVDRDEVAGEAALYAVQAPDELEIYFTSDSDWVYEFGQESTGMSAGASPAHIDHLALAQPWDRADETRLFYRALLGLNSAQEIELAGASGLVRSRSLISPDDSVRIALNVLPSGVRAREGFSDHIAIAVAHLFDIVTQIKASGLVSFMPVPDNYYDDLEARATLHPELLKQLKDTGVMYDEAEGGTFLHIYTVPVGGVSFELLERQGKYAGYGEVNAPIRFAFQRDSTTHVRSGSA